LTLRSHASTSLSARLQQSYISLLGCNNLVTNRCHWSHASTSLSARLVPIARIFTPWSHASAHLRCIYPIPQGPMHLSDPLTHTYLSARLVPNTCNTHVAAPNIWTSDHSTFGPQHLGLRPLDLSHSTCAQFEWASSEPMPKVTCNTEPMPKVTCNNGFSRPSCGLVMRSTAWGPQHISSKRASTT
jgi:hypothetical protein